MTERMYYTIRFRQGDTEGVIANLLNDRTKTYQTRESAERSKAYFERSHPTTVFTIDEHEH